MSADPRRGAAQPDGAAADLLDLAERLARDAGALLRERFAAPRTGVTTKSTSTDMVSDADRAAEDLIFSGLRSERPDDGLLGEESGARAGSSGLRWVVDPLDGTTNFLYGIPQWAVSIACEDADGPLVGAIYDPVRDELFRARRGAGAFLNGEVARASSLEDVSRALVATGFAYRPEARAAAARLLPDLLPAVRDIRRAGAAALDLAWVACGRLDAYYETPIQWWDVAAGTLIVREAGGSTGEIPSIEDGQVGVVASGARIFEPLRARVLAAIGSCP